jgi:hypothetical protein
MEEVEALATDRGGTAAASRGATHTSLQPSTMPWHNALPVIKNMGWVLVQDDDPRLPVGAGSALSQFSFSSFFQVMWPQSQRRPVSRNRCGRTLNRVATWSPHVCPSGVSSEPSLVVSILIFHPPDPCLDLPVPSDPSQSPPLADTCIISLNSKMRKYQTSIGPNLTIVGR